MSRMRFASGHLIWTGALCLHLPVTTARELSDLIGTPRTTLRVEIKRRITEALTQDDRITSVDDWSFETSGRGVRGQNLRSTPSMVT